MGANHTCEGRSPSRVYGERGRCREEAASFVGVSPTKFDEMVADGRMPEPRVIDNRVVWDVYELDEHFDRLPRRGRGKRTGNNGETNRWTVMAA
jgi:predicted DNA-binding transcriptional regulator AlpA